MLVSNSITLTRKSPLLLRSLLSRFAASSCTPNCQNIINPIHVTRRFTTTHSSFNLPSTNGFKDCGGSQLGDCGGSQLGFSFLSRRSFRVSGGGGSGSGGGAGSGGRGGGSSGGNGGDGGGASDWSLLSWYLSLLAKYPVMTKAITSAVLTLIGDLVCQLVIDQVPSLDLKRTSIFTLLGLVLVGPTLHFWYLYLSKLIAKPGASGAVLRLLLDQFVFAPTFIGIFLSTLMTLEGRPSDVIPKLKQEWFSSVVANWQLWIPFQFLNFRFVPQQFQVLAANFISLVWNVILSYKAHKEVVAK